MQFKFEYTPWFFLIYAMTFLQPWENLSFTTHMLKYYCAGIA